MPMAGAPPGTTARGGWPAPPGRGMAVKLRRSRGRDPLGLRRVLSDRLLPSLVAAMALGRAGEAARIMHEQVSASRDMVLAALTAPDAALVLS